MTWLLIVAVLALPLVSTRTVGAEPRCVDEWGGTVYERGEECPPAEVLDRTRPNSKERSELLDHWFNKLDKSTRDAYRKYIECKNDVAKLKAELNQAETDKSLDERHAAAVKELKRALVAAMGRLGLATATILTNAAADAYLFGKAAQQAINDEGGARAKAKAEFEVAADKAQRLTNEAARRQQYVASLEAELAAAEQRVAAAEQRIAGAHEKPPGPSDTPPGTTAEKPSSGAPLDGSGEPGQAGSPTPPSGPGGGATTARGPPPAQRVFVEKPMDPKMQEFDFLQGIDVTYLRGPAQQQRRIHVRDGLIYDANGNLFNTTGGNTIRTKGRAIFVMDGQGNIYASTEHGLGRFHHSSLAAGKPVAAAGEIEVVNGRLTVLSDASGHYKPGRPFTEQAMNRLKELGIDPQSYSVEYTAPAASP